MKEFVVGKEDKCIEGHRNMQIRAVISRIMGSYPEGNQGRQKKKAEIKPIRKAWPVSPLFVNPEYYVSVVLHTQDSETCISHWLSNELPGSVTPPVS